MLLYLFYSNYFILTRDIRKYFTPFKKYFFINFFILLDLYYVKYYNDINNIYGDFIMQRKTLLGIFLLTSILYYIIPLLFLKFYNGSSDKAGLILILAYGFFSFAITVLISYFIERTILTPVFSIFLALPLFFIFNSSALVLILVIIAFSFLGYFLTALLK